MRIAMAIEIQEGFGYDETLSIAQLADESYIQAVVLAEHYCSPDDPNSIDTAPDAWIYLGALARATKNVKIGTLVSPVTFRHPAVYAKMGATLDLISDGRAELGLGAGWLGAEHSAYGFPFPDGPTRVSMLQEQVEIISGLWSTDSFSFKGRYYSLNACSFTPKQRSSRPRILIGGRPSSLRLLSTAARFADEYVLTRGTPEDCWTAKQRLASKSAGRSALLDSVRLGLFTRLALDDGQPASPYKGKTIPSASNHEWIVGSTNVVRDRLLRLMESGVDSVYVSVETPSHASSALAVAEIARGLST